MSRGITVLVSQVVFAIFLRGLDGISAQRPLSDSSGSNRASRNTTWGCLEDVQCILIDAESSFGTLPCLRSGRRRTVGVLRQPVPGDAVWAAELAPVPRTFASKTPAVPGYMRRNLTPRISVCHALDPSSHHIGERGGRTDEKLRVTREIPEDASITSTKTIQEIGEAEGTSTYTVLYPYSPADTPILTHLLPRFDTRHCSSLYNAVT
ncbi:hypothetical protein B0T13DRAFT_528548 [Neurospora crassa]|nr:hypothetical protein B0T13DRAFT_528548 [Neurospora crassa]